jgi:hypothetical protein
VNSQAKFIAIAVLGVAALLVGSATRQGRAPDEDGPMKNAAVLGPGDRGSGTMSAPVGERSIPSLPEAPDRPTTQPSPVPRLPGQTSSERFDALMQRYAVGHYDELGLRDDERAALEAMRTREEQRAEEMRERVLRGELSIDDYIEDIMEGPDRVRKHEAEILGQERYEDLDWLREREGMEHWDELQGLIEDIVADDQRRTDELKDRQEFWEKRRRDRR